MQIPIKPTRILRGSFSSDLCFSLTCAFFSRSVKTENQSAVSASSSKVMMAKANVEPLNCQSWWQAIQCCTCLVHNAAWKPGGLFWCPGPAGSKAGSVAGSQLTPEPSPMDGMRWGWPETSRAWNWTGDEQRNQEERDQNVSIMMSLLCHSHPSFTSNTSSFMSASICQFWQQVNTSPSLRPWIHSHPCGHFHLTVCDSLLLSSVHWCSQSCRLTSKPEAPCRRTLWATGRESHIRIY